MAFAHPDLRREVGSSLQSSKILNEDGTLLRADESSSEQLIEGEDYYVEVAVIVFTARYHLRRGFCCESGCRHCPYNSDEMTEKKAAIG